MAWARRAVKSAALGLALTACDPSATGLDASSWSPREAEPGSCGNGIVEDGEQCDLGFANRADGPCRACARPRCGDGVVDEAEACDDGEGNGRGVCTESCTKAWPRTWTRRLDAGPDDEPVLGLVVAADGDLVHVGAGHRPDDVAARGVLTRRASTSEAHWSWTTDTGGALHAVDIAGDGTIVAAGTVEPARAWLGAFGPDGAPFWSIDLGPGVATDVVAGDDGGWVLVVAPDGTAQVRPFSADGEPGESRALPVAAPPRALATVGGELLVGGGSVDEPAWVGRLGSAAWADDTVAERGEVAAITVTADATVLVAATEVGAVDEAGVPTATSVRVAAFAPTGAAKWSVTLAPAYGRRDATGIALVDGAVLVVGADQIPASVCTERLCPTRPWIAELEPDAGALVRDWNPADVELGRAEAIAADGAFWYVGGTTQPLFSRPDGWLVGLSRADAEGT